MKVGALNGEKDTPTMAVLGGTTRNGVESARWTCYHREDGTMLSPREELSDDERNQATGYR